MAPNQGVIKTNAAGELYLQSDSGRIKRLYRFKEVLSIARIDAMTFYTWVKRGMLPDARLRDRGRWRVFTEHEVTRLIGVAREEGFDVPAWDIGRKQPRHDRNDPIHSNWRESP